MKSSRTEIQSRVHGVPELRFDDQRMTSFGGLVVFHLLFKQLDLKARLRRAFGEVDRARSFGLGTVTDVEDQGDDIKVTVRFGGVGVKKLMARFAGLEPA